MTSVRLSATALAMTTERRLLGCVWGGVVVVGGGHTHTACISCGGPVARINQKSSGNEAKVYKSNDSTSSENIFARAKKTIDFVVSCCSLVTIQSVPGKAHSPYACGGVCNIYLQLRVRTVPYYSCSCPSDPILKQNIARRSLLRIETFCFSVSLLF